MSQAELATRKGVYMACRVGITTDPDRRRREWELEYPNLRDWQVIGTHLSKTAAQAQETVEAARRGCAASAGGDGPEVATWYVYYFDH